MKVIENHIFHTTWPGATYTCGSCLAKLLVSYDDIMVYKQTGGRRQLTIAFKCPQCATFNSIKDISLTLAQLIKSEKEEIVRQAKDKE